MKCYKYTIESVGGVVTELEDVPNRTEFDKESKFIKIEKTGGRIFLPMCNVVRITEEEVEI